MATNTKQDKMKLFHSQQIAVNETCKHDTNVLIAKSSKIHGNMYCQD